MEVAFLTGQVVMALRLGHLRCSADRPAIEVHQAPVRRGMRKNHAAPMPVAGWVRPRARRRIAHAELLRQRQGNAALLQVGLPTAGGQGGLEGGELRRQVRPRRGGLTWRRWACRWRPGERRRYG